MYSNNIVDLRLIIVISSVSEIIEIKDEGFYWYYVLL